jgi:hypothetical protein
MMALKMLLVRVDLAGISCVLGVTEETVLAWLSVRPTRRKRSTDTSCGPAGDTCNSTRCGLRAQARA